MIDLTSPTWWLGVVVVGLLLNLASAYIKSAIDRSVLSSAAWWRNRSAKRAEQFEKMVDAIMEEGNQEHAKLLISRRFTGGIQMLSLAIWVLALACAVILALSDSAPDYIRKTVFFCSLFVSYLGLSMSITDFRRLRRTEDALFEARRRLASRPQAKSLQR